MDRWIGKVAVVTGASSGMGAAVSEELVKLGLAVVGIAPQTEFEKFEELKRKLETENGEFYYFIGDVCKEEEIINIFQKIKKDIGPVSILINCAGICRLCSLVDGNYDYIKDTFKTNTVGLCYTTREAIKQMLTNNINGHVIHINSYIGHAIPREQYLNMYPASKRAVTALTEILRNELSFIDSKIKVSSISPGIVQTEIWEKIIKDSNLVNDADDMDKAKAAVVTDLPFLSPMDISDAIIFILSTPPHVQIHELMIKPVGEGF